MVIIVIVIHHTEMAVSLFTTIKNKLTLNRQRSEVSIWGNSRSVKFYERNIETRGLTCKCKNDQNSATAQLLVTRNNNVARIYVLFDDEQFVILF